MLNLAVRPNDHLLAKTAAFVLNRDICDIVGDALKFYLERKSPRTMELFNEQQKGKVGA